MAKVIKVESPIKVLKSKPAPAAGDLKEGQIAIGNVSGKPTVHGKIGEVIIDLTKKTKADVGLANVTDDAQVKRSEMGKPDGVATLDRTGKVPSGQLPSFVDDVVDIVTVMDTIPSRDGKKGEVIGVIGTEKGLYSFKSGSAWEKSGDWETGKIYLTEEASAELETGSKYGANAVLRWSGTALAQVNNPLVIGKVKGTAFDGGDGKALEDWKEKMKPLAAYSNGSVTQREQSVDIEFEAYTLGDPLNMRDETVSIPAASGAKAGVMTAADKTKLDAIPEGGSIVTSVVLETVTI